MKSTGFLRVGHVFLTIESNVRYQYVTNTVKRIEREVKLILLRSYFFCFLITRIAGIQILSAAILR